MRYRGRQSRSVSYVYGGLALTLFVVVAAVALVVSPPAPPSLAEYAPRSEQQIDEAPSEQSSRFGGQGAGACAAGQTCEEPDEEQAGRTTSPTTSTTRQVIVKTNVRRCVGSPPRQTEDPQSPPCVNYWDGDNGGATSRGVTPHEIRVAVHYEQDLTFYDRLIEHFNRRYQFYGRKISLVNVTSSYETEAKVEAAAEVEPFAVLGLSDGTDTEAWQRATARRKMISVVAAPKSLETHDYRELAPYAWTYMPTLDERQRHLGQFVCSSLAERRPRVPTGSVASDARKFAVWVLSEPGGHIPLTALRAELDRCDVEPTVYEVDAGFDPIQMANLFGSMRNEGITSVLLQLPMSVTTSLMTKKAKDDYQVEWVLGGFEGDDHELLIASTAPADQRQWLFGVFPSSKLLPGTDTPAYWAARESDPAADPADAETPIFRAQYRALLLLASGIQLAGPNLTPQTFERGLQRARFANADAAAAPYWQSTVGFAPGDYSMTTDVAAVWWNETVRSQGGRTTGGYCFVGRGERFALGRWRDVDSELYTNERSRCR